MRHILLKFWDILRAYLPENDFGKMIAKNNYLATGGEKRLGEWDISLNGTMVILEALFGKTSYKKVRYRVQRPLRCPRLSEFHMEVARM